MYRVDKTKKSEHNHEWLQIHMMAFEETKKSFQFPYFPTFTSIM